MSGAALGKGPWQSLSVASTTRLSICVHACDPGALEVPLDGSEVKAYLAMLRAQEISYLLGWQ